MSQITGVLFLLAICLSTTSFAQTLQEMQKRYDQISPFERDRFKDTKMMVNPEESTLTPAEEQLAELKEKEAADKAAQEQKIYLDTDYHFFQSMNAITLEEDELDKVYKNVQATENIATLKQTDQSVRSELKTAAPQTKVLSPAEAAAADARRLKILKRIASNGSAVKKCILENRKDKEEFKGTVMTLSWMVETSGQVTHAQIKDTDVENKAIQDCVVKSLAEISFKEESGDPKVTAHIEYTYKFSNPAKAVAAQ